MPDALMRQQAFCQAHHERYGQEDVKAGSDMFCNLLAQICWLADRLSEARILVGHDQCSRCRLMSFVECSRCWRLKAAETVRKERRAK